MTFLNMAQVLSDLSRFCLKINACNGKNSYSRRTILLTSAGSITTVSGTATTCLRTATLWRPSTPHHQSPGAAWTGTTGRRGRSCTRLLGRSTPTEDTTGKPQKTGQSWWCLMCTPPRPETREDTTTTTTGNHDTRSGTRLTAPPTTTNPGIRSEGPQTQVLGNVWRSLYLYNRSDSNSSEWTVTLVFI